MTCLAWNTTPSLAALCHAIEQHTAPLYLIVCLPENHIPDFPLSNQPSELEGRLNNRLVQAMKCLQFNSVNILENLLPDVHLWLVPPHRADCLHEHFHHIEWQTEAIPQVRPSPLKPWFRRPEHQAAPEHVLIIGAGIAGAATAHKLAEHGVRVTVLEAGKAAQAGSGNRQGLLYAKISPHDTEQTELLLTGYGYTRRLLEDLLPDSDVWGGDGVLHLNFDDSERKRNQALGLQHQHKHLYHSVSAEEAAHIAGIDVFSDGLYWPQGVWLNPPTVVHALLNHPLIELHEHSPLTAVSHDGTQWMAHTPDAHSTPAISFTAWARTARLPPTPTSPPCLSAKSAAKPALCPQARFHKSCVAPFPAKATSVRAGKAATATARHLSSTATMKLGIQTKKSTTVPPFNNSIRHWHNPCLIKIRFQTAFTIHKAMPPCVATASTTCPLSAHSATSPPCSPPTPSWHWTKTTASTISPALTCPMPTSIRHTARAAWRQPPSAPPPLRPKYSACPIRYRKG